MRQNSHSKSPTPSKMNNNQGFVSTSRMLSKNPSILAEIPRFSLNLSLQPQELTKNPKRRFSLFQFQKSFQETWTSKQEIQSFRVQPNPHSFHELDNHLKRTQNKKDNSNKLEKPIFLLVLIFPFFFSLASCCSVSPSLNPNSLFPRSVSNFFASNSHFFAVSGIFFLLNFSLIDSFPVLHCFSLGTNLLAFNRNLVFSDNLSFDLVYSPSSEAGYLPDSFEFFVRNSDNSIKIFDSTGSLTTSTTLDSNSGSRSFFFDEDTNYFCLIESSKVVLQDVYSSIESINITPDAGYSFLDCSVRPGAKEVQVIAYDGVSSLRISFYDSSTAVERVSSVQKYTPAAGFGLEHGKWVNSDSHVLVFSSGNNPVGLDYSQSLPMRFDCQNYGSNAYFNEISSFGGKWAIGWNLVTSKFEVFSSRMIKQKSLEKNIPTGWSSSGNVASLRDDSRLAIYSEPDGFLEAWDVSNQEVLVDLEPHAKGGAPVHASELDSGNIIVIKNGNHVLEINRSTGHRVFSQTCRFLDNYEYPLSDAYVFTDQITTNIVMVGNSGKMTILYFEAGLCQKLILSSISSDHPLDLLNERVPYFVDFNNLNFITHSFQAVVSHGFGAHSFKHLPWTNWAFLVPLSSVTALQIIDFTSSGSYTVKCTLNVLSPGEFAWVHRSTHSVVIKGTNTLVFYVSDILTASGTISVSGTIASSPSMTLTGMSVLKDMDYAVVWADGALDVLVEDFLTVSIVVTVSFSFSFEDSTLEFYDAFRSTIYTSEVLFSGSFGIFAVDLSTLCLLDMTKSSSCHDSCDTCTDSTIQGCSSCHSGTYYDSASNQCRRSCISQPAFSLREHRHNCHTTCNLQSASQNGNYCNYYQDGCDSSSPAPIYDKGQSMCSNSCVTSGENFLLHLYQCSTVNQWSISASQSFENSVFWGGSEMCVLAGMLSADFTCKSLLNCLSDGKKDAGVHPYCEADCNSISAGTDFFSFYDPFDNTCHSIGECSSANPYPLSGINECAPACSDSTNVLLDIGLFHRCVDSLDATQCGGNSLFLDSSTQFCESKNACSVFTPNSDLTIGQCRTSADRSSSLYWDSDHNVMVGDQYNCGFGTNNYGTPTFECISIFQCNSLSYTVSLSTRECSGAVCSGSESDGVCCDIISATGCAMDGLTPCDSGCTPFSCYGGLPTECCHPSCKTCSGAGFSDCLSCSAGYEALNGACCDASCKTCSGLLSTNCLTCSHGGYFHSSDNHCSATAPVVCDSSCLTCSNSDGAICSTCISGLFLHSSDSSCSTCSSALGYFSSAGSLCGKCPSNCETCSGLNGNDCLTCPNGFFMHVSDSHCDSSCSSDNSFYSEGGECLECHPDCATCNGSRASDCLSCNDQSLLISETTLLCQTCSANAGYFISQEWCLKCSSRCKTCDGPLFNDCLSCQGSLYLYNSDNHCGSCSNTENVYADSVKKLCFECHSYCDKCTGTTNADCVECIEGAYNNTVQAKCLFDCSDGLYTVQGTNLCTDSCPSGTYSLANFTCASCQQNCEECTADDCITCKSGFHYYDGYLSKNTEAFLTFLIRFFLPNRKCNSECPLGDYETSTTPPTCLPCSSSSCLVCTNGDLNSCLMCQDETFLVNGVCSSKCPSLYYPEESTNTCEKCYSDSCKYCTEMVRNTTSQKCVFCKEVEGLSETSKGCLDICGDGLRFPSEYFEELLSYIECDDGNQQNGDGCSSSCELEFGYQCSGGSPSSKDTCKVVTNPYNNKVEYQSDFADPYQTAPDDAEPLTAKISYLSNNGTVIQVKFTNDLISPSYTLRLISFWIETLYSDQYDFGIEFLSKSAAQFELVFFESVHDAVAVIEFIEPTWIKDIYAQELQTRRLEVDLPIIDVSATASDGLEYDQSTVSTSMTSGVAALTAVTLVSNLLGQSTASKGLLWTLVYLLQNMAYYVLINVDYPSNFRVFIKIFITSNIPFYSQMIQFTKLLLFSGEEEETFYSDTITIKEAYTTETFRMLPNGLKQKKTLNFLQDQVLSGDFGPETTSNSPRILMKERKSPYSFIDYGVETTEVYDNVFLTFLILFIQCLGYLFTLLFFYLVKSFCKKSCTMKPLKRLKSSFEWGIFLNTIRTEFMEITLFSLVNLRYSNPETIYDFVNFILSVLILVMNCSLFALTVYGIREKKLLAKKSFKSLLEDYKPDPSKRRYFILVEFGRGVLLSIGFSLLYDIRFLQISIIVFVNCLHLALMVIFRPFNLKMVFFRELLLSSGFSVASFLVMVLVIDEKVEFMEIESRSYIGIGLIAVFSLMLGYGFLLVLIEFLSQLFGIGKALNGIIKKNREIIAERKDSPQKIKIAGSSPRRKKTETLTFNEVDVTEFARTFEIDYSPTRIHRKTDHDHMLTIKDHQDDNTNFQEHSQIQITSYSPGIKPKEREETPTSPKKQQEKQRVIIRPKQLSFRSLIKSNRLVEELKLAQEELIKEFKEDHELAQNEEINQLSPIHGIKKIKREKIITEEDSFQVEKALRTSRTTQKRESVESRFSQYSPEFSVDGLFDEEEKKEEDFVEVKKISNKRSSSLRAMKASDNSPNEVKISKTTKKTHFSRHLIVGTTKSIKREAPHHQASDESVFTRMARQNALGKQEEAFKRAKTQLRILDSLSPVQITSSAKLPNKPKSSKSSFKGSSGDHSSNELRSPNKTFSKISPEQDSPHSALRSHDALAEGIPFPEIDFRANQTNIEIHSMQGEGKDVESGSPQEKGKQTPKWDLSAFNMDK